MLTIDRPHHRPTAAFCFLIGALLGPLPAAAAPIVTQRVDYYDVAGATPSDIRADLNRLRPESKGERHDALTRWNVRWRYTYKISAQDCSFASVTTTLDVVITMPRLKPDASVPAAVARQFSDYLERLMLHEQGHVDGAIDFAKRIDAGIRALPPQPSCDALGKAANALGNDLVKQAQQSSDEYDARTLHGRTQGARFP